MQSTSVTFTFTVTSPLLSATVNPVLPPVFAPGVPTTPYTLFTSVTGGEPPYKFAFDPQTPFPGMSIDDGGVLTGTPAAEGTVKVNVVVSDSGK